MSPARPLLLCATAIAVVAAAVPAANASSAFGGAAVVAGVVGSAMLESEAIRLVHRQEQDHESIY